MAYILNINDRGLTDDRRLRPTVSHDILLHRTYANDQQIE